MPSNDAFSDTISIESRSITEDDDVFITPGPSLVRDFDTLPRDAHTQFSLFPTNTPVSPSKSSTLGRIWHDFNPRLLTRFSPSRKSASTHPLPQLFADNDSILARKAPRPARMLDDSSSYAESQTDSQDFLFTDAVSIDSRSSHSSADSTSRRPQFSASLISLTDAELAARARQRESAAANSDGRLREAPSVEAALAALNDIGKVLNKGISWAQSYPKRLPS
ncbi:hypothetical protein R3P38DRAFT_3215708 [Favolaschia claudopus]|uniref:Uncharacterized protein n=1 Tax=Favolaschia claudopus TaxID=2862362 RepID=A0AAW0A8H1_9AGAR